MVGPFHFSGKKSNSLWSNLSMEMRKTSAVIIPAERVLVPPSPLFQARVYARPAKLYLQQKEQKSESQSNFEPEPANHYISTAFVTIVTGPELLSVIRRNAQVHYWWAVLAVNDSSPRPVLPEMCHSGRSRFLIVFMCPLTVWKSEAKLSKKLYREQDKTFSSVIQVRVPFDDNWLIFLWVMPI